jgi:hypothetical protein
MDAPTDGDAERSNATVASRRAGSGRVEFITDAVRLQRALSKISASIKDCTLNLAEHGVELNQVQRDALADARSRVLDAADRLHSVAIQLLDVEREERQARA